mgnify:CR=1 FL=1
MHNNGKILLEGEHAMHWETRMQNGASMTIRCANKAKPLIAVAATNRLFAEMHVDPPDVPRRTAILVVASDIAPSAAATPPATASDVGSVAKAVPPLVGSVAKAAAPPGRVAPAAVLHAAAQVDAAAAAPVAVARPHRGAVFTRAVTQWTPHAGWERLTTRLASDTSKARAADSARHATSVLRPSSTTDDSATS